MNLIGDGKALFLFNDVGGKLNTISYLFQCNLLVLLPKGGVL